MTTNTSGYEMWLTFNGEKEKIQIPVLPETISVSLGSSNTSINIADLGEIVIMQSRPAFTYQFSSFFPKFYCQGVNVSKLTSPLVLVSKIKTWKEADTPVHFVISDVGISVYCIIESFAYYENGGDVGTIYYNLTLKEYREVAARQVNVDVEKGEASIQKEDERVDNTQTPKTYTVKKGDCLWNIAKQYYGSGSDYNKIFDANRDVIGGNPNLIYPGQVLTIP